MVIPTYTCPEDLNTTDQGRSDVIDCMNALLKRDYFLETEVDPIISVPAQWDALTSDEQALWTNYKNDLNAITCTCAGWPSSITWPTKP